MLLEGLTTRRLPEDETRPSRVFRSLLLHLDPTNSFRGSKLLLLSCSCSFDCEEEASLLVRSYCFLASL